MGATSNDNYTLNMGPFIKPYPVTACINISGGNITATGGQYGAGIGGIPDSSGGAINITGGTIISTGGAGDAYIVGGAGIGGG